MPKKKEEIVVEEEEEVLEESPVPESEEKQAFRELIEKYKTQNPKKYAEKKERLEEKLNQMK